jgi:tripartite-type tricarboxylate transporter receptor subunit TctC
VFVGRGTPRAAVDVLNAALNRILADEGFRARVRDLGLRPIGGSPDDFRRFLIEDAAAWERVVRDNDIRVE